jgi:hypothetical protein
VRRRWGRFAAGATLALLGGWVFASLYVSAGERVEVLVAARDIGRYETIESGDLRVERVAAGPGVEAIETGDADALVGRVAASDLPEGALVAPDQIFAEDERLVSDTEIVVGAYIGPADAPDTSLAVGTDVVVAIRPSQQSNSPAPIREVDGWISEIGPSDENTGKQRVSVVVPESAAGEVAAAASEERVSLLVREAG